MRASALSADATSISILNAFERPIGAFCINIGNNFTRHHIAFKRSNFLLIYLRKIIYFTVCFSCPDFDYIYMHMIVIFGVRTKGEKIKDNLYYIIYTYHIPCGTYIPVNQFIPHEN